MSEMIVTTQDQTVEWRSVFNLLELRARRDPGRGFYVRDGRGAQEFRTFSQLLATSKRIARGLGNRGVVTGDRVLLAQRTGFDFLVTFFGVQALGAVPIPLEWPRNQEPFGGVATLARWRRLAQRYDADVLVCDALEGRSESGWTGLWPPHPLRVVTDVAHLLDGIPSRVELKSPDIEVDDVAYIQSTSGTTGARRGVQLTHRGIAASVDAIGRRIEVRGDDVLVSWLPLGNIMGLVGVVIFSLHWGIRPVLLHAEAFLEQPEDWFWAISEHRATLSLAPNFAFNYCVRRCNASKLEGLDLSSWRIAMNGSEPVRAQHIQAFARRFHKYGLGDHVVMPVYGLSEATLGVTFHPAGEPIRIDGINRRDLEWEKKATPLPSDGADKPSERMHVVSVGRALDGVELRIVDDRGEPVGERRLGEIAIRGPNVMAGYVEATVRDDDPAPSRIDEKWLYTGDLGYVADGDLFFVTRASDQVVLESGRMVVPEEVELFVDAIDGVRSGSTAVFMASDEIVERHGEAEGEGVVVAFEVQTGADAQELGRAICTVLERHLDLSPAYLQALPVGSVPKTPTGKVRRHHCRRLMEKGLLGEAQKRFVSATQLADRARDLGDMVRGSGEFFSRRLREVIDKV